MDILIAVSVMIYVTSAVVVGGAYIYADIPEVEKLGATANILVFIGVVIISPLLMLVVLTGKRS